MRLCVQIRKYNWCRYRQSGPKHTSVFCFHCSTYYCIWNIICSFL